MTAKKHLTMDDLPPETRRQVLAQVGRKRRSKPREFTAEHERRYAIRVLNEIADLSQQQRKRVLARAQRLNDV